MAGEKRQKTTAPGWRSAEMHRAIAHIIKKKAAVFLLWLLTKKEMHGYDIIKTLSKEKMHGTGPKGAMIYPILNSLCKKKLLSCRIEKKGKQEKKLYRTTKKGEEYIKIAKKEYDKSILMRRFMKEMVM